MEFLELRLGFSLSGYLYQRGVKAFESRKCKRLGRAASWEEYKKLFLNEEKEWAEFLHEFTIKTTSWFRTPRDFLLLSRHLIPEILARKRHVAIWSAGCSTGEEVWSILFTLLECPALSSFSQVYLLGSDVDPLAVEKAREGRFTKEELKGVLPRYASYFRPLSSEEWEIKQEYRRLVEFKVCNLAQSFYPSPPSGKWDVIFCRNVLIYLRQDVVQDILFRFASLLEREGVLILGYAEYLFGGSLGIFQSESREGMWFLRKGRKETLKRSRQVIPKRIKQRVSRKKVDSLPFFLPKKPPQREEVPQKKAFLDFYQESLDFLEKGKEAYWKGDLLKSLEFLERALEKDFSCSEAYLWLGIVLSSLGQEGMAEQAFRKALFLDGRHPLPPLCLGLLLEEAGQVQEVKRMYQMAYRRLERRGEWRKDVEVSQAKKWLKYKLEALP